MKTGSPLARASAVALACLFLAACGGEAERSARIARPLSAVAPLSSTAPTVAAAPEPQSEPLALPTQQRLRFPIDRCDHAYCVPNGLPLAEYQLRPDGWLRGEHRASARLTVWPVRAGAFSEAMSHDNPLRGQSIGLQSGFDDAMHSPITLGAYLLDPSSLRHWEGPPGNFHSQSSGMQYFVMVGTEQNFTDWGSLNAIHETRETLDNLPVALRRPDIDIRYGHLEDGAGADTIQRFFADLLHDAATGTHASPWSERSAAKVYLADRTLHYKALRYRSPPVVHLIGSPTLLEMRETIAAVQVINSALPEDFKLTIGETLSGAALPANRSDRNRENIIAIEHVDLPEGQTSLAGHAAGTAYNEFRPDGSIARSHIRVGRQPRHNVPGLVDLTGVLVHELAHSLGFYGHTRAGLVPFSVPTFRSISDVDGREVWPIDREALRVLYSRLDPGDPLPFGFGPWASDSLHIHGNMAHAGFGVALRNGYAEPWAYGNIPVGYLADNEALSGEVSWTGTLLGLTPAAESVMGAATLAVDMDAMTGKADFTGLESWTGAPGSAGTGTTWGDGDLRYTIAVFGNAFRETGGDDGRLTGSFTGRAHEGAAGTVERRDLTAAFGGSR